MKNNKTNKLMREVVELFKDTATSLLSWIIGYPLGLIIKRDPGLTVVMSRPGGMFADNSKYFFVYGNDLRSPDERIFLLTSDRRLQEMIVKAGGNAMLHPTLPSLLLLLKCSKCVTDLFVSGYYPLTIGALLVQIWHGAPLKYVELKLHEKRLARSSFFVRTLLNLQKRIIGRYPTYDIVVSTSQHFIEKAFQDSFKARRFVATGYPRNDILFGWPKPDTLAWRLATINVDQQAMDAARKARSKGTTLCLYAPTFRNDLSDPFQSVIDLSTLSTFALLHNILIVLKLHPFMQGKYEISNYPNLMEYDPHGDVYPLMALCDILITDYSSIYFDYLLLDRPVVFFSYDLDIYLSKDRDMYFEYETMTPGAKCRTQEDLEKCLKDILARGCQDDYALMRRKIKSFTHDHDDGQSCLRLIQECLLMTKSQRN